MSFFLTNFIAAFLLPPLCFLPSLALATFYFKRRPRVARVILIGTTALLYIAATPFFVDGALVQLEQHHAALHAHVVVAPVSVPLGPGHLRKNGLHGRARLDDRIAADGERDHDLSSKIARICSARFRAARRVRRNGDTGSIALDAGLMRTVSLLVTIGVESSWRCSTHRSRSRIQRSRCSCVHIANPSGMFV